MYKLKACTIWFVSSPYWSGTWRNSIQLVASQYNLTIDGMFPGFKTVQREVTLMSYKGIFCAQDTQWGQINQQFL
jgi:hypothetical protein